MTTMTTMTTTTMTTTERPFVPKRSVAFLAALLLSTSLAAQGALAQTDARQPHDRVTEALETLGFSVDRVSRTWLGRIRIEASKGSVSRELIVNRTTGEVLRDYWEDEDDEDDEDEPRRRSG